MAIELTDMMDNILIVFSEQIHGILQINIVVNQVDGVTRNNASCVKGSVGITVSFFAGKYFAVSELRLRAAKSAFR
ncbi:Uncharacterised protein [Serratia marcescens]|nr:Uncharacterised protein [Serratia marcescens]